jgi:hypothetical protein
MDTTAVIVIVVVAVILLGLGAVFVVDGHEHRRLAQREEAAELRRLARLHEAQAERQRAEAVHQEALARQAQAEADEKAALARSEKLEAERRVGLARRHSRLAQEQRARADDIDPDGVDRQRGTPGGRAEHADRDDNSDEPPTSDRGPDVPLERRSYRMPRSASIATAAGRTERASSR